MAGIEKICEYSGDYPGWLMYGYKFNHIQIMPEYRKLFRGKTAKLIFFKAKEENVLCLRSRFGCYKLFGLGDDYKRIGRKLYRWVKDPRKPDTEILKPVSEAPYYEYALIVPDLPGQVRGIYMNWSYNKGAVLRKLKRLIGKTLVIEKSPLTYWEWRENEQ